MLRIHGFLSTLALVPFMAAGVASGAANGAAPPTEKPKSFRLKPDEKALLLSIAEKDANDPFVVQDRNDPNVKALLKHKLLMFNEVAATGENKQTVPAVVSELGRQKADAYIKADAAANRETSELPEFELETDIPPPETRRGSAPRSNYPFDTMPLNSSFFLPPTGRSDSPAKSKQSTVSQANRKAAEEFEARKAAGDPEANAEGAQPKRFRIAEWTQKDAAGNDVKGARVWRIQ